MVWIDFEVKCHLIRNKNRMRFGLDDYSKKFKAIRSKYMQLNLDEFLDIKNAIFFIYFFLRI